MRDEGRCGLWVVGCGLWVVGCGLWVVGMPGKRRSSKVAGWGLWVADGSSIGFKRVPCLGIPIPTS